MGSHRWCLLWRKRWETLHVGSKMGLPASYLLVTVAFCAVLHYDAQFRQDLFDGIKGMQGRWFHVLLAGFAMYSMYTKITRHLRMERLKGGVGLRLRVNKKLGWVVVE